MHRISRPITVAATAAVAIVVWWSLVVAFIYQGNWTGLFCTGDHFPVPPELRSGTYIFHNSYGYDGQFYRSIAHDLSINKTEPYLDSPRLRFGRILVPILAYVLAAGNDWVIDFTYIGIVLVSIAAGVYWTACYAENAGRAVWWGLAFVLLPGVLTSIDRMLLDGTLAAVTAAFCLYVTRDRWKAVWPILVLAPFVRETGAILGIAMVVFFALRKQWRFAAIAAMTQLPFGVWWIYVRLHTPAFETSTILGRPVYGALLRVFQPEMYNGPAMIKWLVESTDVIAAAAYVVACGLGIWLVVRGERNAAAIAALLFAAVGLATGGEGYLVVPYAFSRAITPLLLILLFDYFRRGNRVELFDAFAMSPSILLYFGAEAARIVHLTQ